MSPIRRLANRLPSFPRLGELRKGAERTPEDLARKKPGGDLKWFRFTAQPGEEGVAARFQEVYGDRPTDINVYLPYTTTDECFETWQEAWVAGGLVHRCDGERCVLWLDRDGTYATAPEGLGPNCPGGCKQVGRLRVIVPELKRMAYVTVLTTSLHDVMNLREQIAQVEATVRLLSGSLQGIPFVLRRRPRRISMPRVDKRTGEVTRVRAEKWLLSIEPNPDWVADLLDRMQRLALPGEGHPGAPQLGATNGPPRAALLAPTQDLDSPPADDFGGEPVEEEDDEAEYEELPDPELRDAPPLAAPPPEPEAALDELAEWVGNVRARVTQHQSERAHESASAKQLGWAKGIADETVGKEHRNALAKALFGMSLFDALTVAQASVLIDLAVERVGDGWRPRPEFAPRAQRLVVRATGQKEMALS